MKYAQDIILKPVITERSMDLIREQRKYTFKVAKDANKIEIKNAIEEIFKVKVAAVNVMRYDGKEKRMGVHTGFRADWKKAIVRLKASSKTIEIFEGMV